jgi:hypothetical protein
MERQQRSLVACMSLQDRPILIIDRTFVHQLLNALEAEGAEVVVAVDGDEARNYLKQFKFSTVLVGDPPRLSMDLFEALGDVPVIFYGERSTVAGIKPPSRTLPRNVTAILRALKDLMR